mmetsp:Transcript_8820/g.22838  ORF Transcript_8820/g.22838 Transcript_8820/m.22838 type:complete len:284 (-) Transcript_8820:1495-2346(-)
MSGVSSSEKTSAGAPCSACSGGVSLSSNAPPPCTITCDRSSSRCTSCVLPWYTNHVSKVKALERWKSSALSPATAGTHAPWSTPRNASSKRSGRGSRDAPIVSAIGDVPSRHSKAEPTTVAAFFCLPSAASVAAVPSEPMRVGKTVRPCPSSKPYAMSSPLSRSSCSKVGETASSIRSPISCAARAVDQIRTSSRMPANAWSGRRSEPPISSGPCDLPRSPPRPSLSSAHSTPSMYTYAPFLSKASATCCHRPIASTHAGTWRSSSAPLRPLSVYHRTIWLAA